ncbi:hypothetical protein [Corynebacterium accolens]|nr:hypothetical protein [Corynebacterium accolens]MDK8468497.1 hypothetical protein [Corynebacterium accolens]MDK8497672.1 hypothetical protein [Corynebacterium accolens]MDK8591891.1 hypothetical protein [Corynebacterium accolens]MDK8674414.1 hypothetical protein [Corynebacterium accolens]
MIDSETNPPDVSRDALAKNEESARRWYSKSEPKVLPAPTNAPGK